MTFDNSTVFRVIQGSEITSELLQRCAALFSQNYGIWSTTAPLPLTSGARIRMNSKTLKHQCLSDTEHSMLAVCVADGVIIGHAFATLWPFDGANICWITQLVVSSKHRRRGIATALLKLLPGNGSECHAFGLVSSHPAACLALCKRGSANMRKLDLAYIKEHAPGIFATSPVPYLKTARFCGSLFEDSGEAHGVCSAFTNFHVDHDEPLEALRGWQESQDMSWPLGGLPEGNEFLCIVPNYSTVS